MEVREKGRQRNLAIQKRKNGKWSNKRKGQIFELAPIVGAGLQASQDRPR